MTVTDIISRADELRPNSITPEAKLSFLSDIEGQVKVLIYKDHPAGIKPLTEKDDSKILSVPHPFDRLYIHYLCAMYAWCTGDTELYTNDRIVFEAAWSDYAKWYQRTGGGAGHGNV